MQTVLSSLRPSFRSLPSTLGSLALLVCSMVIEKYLRIIKYDNLVMYFENVNLSVDALRQVSVTGCELMSLTKQRTETDRFTHACICKIKTD